MKLRMRVGKEGIVKFIGHLDIMRYFQKAFRRANVDITYSQATIPIHVCPLRHRWGSDLRAVENIWTWK